MYSGYGSTIKTVGGEDAAGGRKIETRMLLNSLNYHGQQLASFIKDSEACRGIDTKAVNYHVYQQRSRELRMEDRGKRLLLHRFIAQKSTNLFGDPSLASTGRSDTRGLNWDQVDEHAALLPPLESFTNIDEEDRCKQFFECVDEKDTIFCRLQQKSVSGLVLNILALDPITGKSRYIEDLKIKCFCPTNETIPCFDPKEPHRNYAVGDYIKVVILESKVDSQRIIGSMRSECLPKDLQNIIKLGLVDSSELPTSLIYSRQVEDRGLTYEEFLHRSIGFINPTNVNHLCEELGLDQKNSSLLNTLEGKFKSSHFAPQLRREQASKWAFRHVHQGIKHFKAGNSMEAFQCLNQALNIDPQNVEGLVARGALYANNGGLEKAITDFEAALEVNPSHQNAKKYLCETLVAVARGQEDEKKVEVALETYEKILRIDPNHREAMDSVVFLRGRPQDGSTESLRASEHDDQPPPDWNKSRTDMQGGADRGRPRKEKRDKKSRRSGSSGSRSSVISVESVDRSEASKQRLKKTSERRSRSASESPERRKSIEEGSSARGPTPGGSRREMSPFSQKLNQPAQPPVPKIGDGVVVPAGYPQVPAGYPGYPPHHPAYPPHMHHPGQPLPVVAGVPRPPYVGSVIDLSRPPPPFAGYPGQPGYRPSYIKTQDDKDYDDKVNWFLQQTNAGRSYTHRSVRHNDGRGQGRDYQSRRRRNSKSRDRSRSYERERRSKRRDDSRDRDGRSSHRDDSRGRDGRSSHREDSRGRDARSSHRNDSCERSYRDDDDDRHREVDDYDDRRRESSKRRRKESESETRQMSASPDIQTIEDAEETRSRRKNKSKHKDKKHKGDEEDVGSEEESPKHRHKKKKKKKSTSPENRETTIIPKILEKMNDLKNQLQKLNKDSSVGREDEDEQARSPSRSRRKRSQSRDFDPEKPKKAKKQRHDDSDDDEIVLLSDNEKRSRKKDDRGHHDSARSMSRQRQRSREVDSPSRGHTRNEAEARSHDRSHSRDARRRSRDRSRSRDARDRHHEDRHRSQDRSRSREARDRHRSRDRSRSPRDKRRSDRSPKERNSTRLDRSASVDESGDRKLDERYYDSRKGSVKLPSGGGLWIPTGADSLQQQHGKVKESLPRASAKTMALPSNWDTLSQEEKIKRAQERVQMMEKEREEKEKSRKDRHRHSSRRRTPSPKRRFDPTKKIQLSTDAPAPAQDYDVTYDPKIGMYIRVPKGTANTTKAEKIASSKKSEMDKEKTKQESGEKESGEERIIRSVGSPPSSTRSKRSHSKDRERSRDHGGRSRDRRDRSRDRKSHRDRSRERRDRSRDRKDRSRDDREPGKDDRYRSWPREVIERPDDHRGNSTDFPQDGKVRPGFSDYERQGNRGAREEYDYEMEDMLMESRRLKEEREMIEREKAEIMAMAASSPNPVGGSSSNKDSKSSKTYSEPESVESFLRKKKAEKEKLLAERK